jgi:hypothetical protein
MPAGGSSRNGGAETSSAKPCQHSQEEQNREEQGGHAVGANGSMASGPWEHQDVKHCDELLRPEKASNPERQTQLDYEWNTQFLHAAAPTRKPVRAGGTRSSESAVRAFKRQEKKADVPETLVAGRKNTENIAKALAYVL